MQPGAAVRDALWMVLFQMGACGTVILMQQSFDTEAIAPMVFVLAVFLTSLVTNGCLWGIAASLIGVLAVNYAFTFPYFEFNFTLSENMFSGLVMLFVAVTTGTLTSNLKTQERIRAEGELERMRANLLRAVSHDLRTPLTSIYGACSTVTEHYDSLDKEQQLKLLGEVCSDAEWLGRMVENLLSITRIDSESVRVTKTDTVLEELVDAVLVKFQKYYPGQPVEVDLPDVFITIPMDSILIEQVLINLLENAVLHAEGMTRLTLRVSVAGQRALFEVVDNGCGISQDSLSGRFVGGGPEGKSTVDRGRRSMGIGLSMCATIVEVHGGELLTDSVPGCGTTFRFMLKLEEDSYGQQ